MSSLASGRILAIALVSVVEFVPMRHCLGFDYPAVLAAENESRRRALDEAMAWLEQNQVVVSGHQESAPAVTETVEVAPPVGATSLEQSISCPPPKEFMPYPTGISELGIHLACLELRDQVRQWAEMGKLPKGYTITKSMVLAKANEMRQDEAMREAGSAYALANPGTWKKSPNPVSRALMWWFGPWGSSRRK